MDNSLLYILMLVGGIVMGVIPFLVFMGLGTLFGIGSPNFSLMVTLFVLTVLFSFGMSFASFVAVQKHKCGKVQDYGSISKYAGISTVIQTGVLLLVTFVPWLQGIVTKLMPPDTDSLVQVSASYGYYSFWGILFGLAFGGNMSSMC